MTIEDEMLGRPSGQTADNSLESQMLAKPPGALKKLGSRIADVGLSTLKGAIGVPESIVGLADLVTGGDAGKLAEKAGFRPKEAKAFLDPYYSDAQKAANAEVEKAEGFLPTVGAMVHNPSTILHQAVESAPSMITGGAVARGLMKAAPALGPIAAGAMGEGAVAAGQNAEQVRQDDPNGTLTGKQAAILAASGGLTGLIGFGSGQLANKLGIGELSTMLAAGRVGAVGADAVEAGAKKGIMRKIGEGALVEGIGQELPQSYQEQVATNLAQDKPWDEGAAKAGAQGMLAGALLGGIGGPLSSDDNTAPPPPPAANPLTPGAAPATPAAPAAPAGPLAAAAALVPGGAPSAGPKPLFPFSDMSLAQKQADASTLASGIPHEAVEHPTVPGRFASQPAGISGTDDLFVKEAERQGVDASIAQLASHGPGAQQLLADVMAANPDVDPQLWRDPAMRAQLGAAYLKQNIEALGEAIGHAPTPAEHYIAQLLGVPAATAMLTMPEAERSMPVSAVIADPALEDRLGVTGMPVDDAMTLLTQQATQLLAKMKGSGNANLATDVSGPGPGAGGPGAGPAVGDTERDAAVSGRPAGRTDALGGAPGAGAGDTGNQPAGAGAIESPRGMVGPTETGYQNVNAQRHRDMADQLGLTAKIEEHFGDGLTINQVVGQIQDKVPGMAPADVPNFVNGVRQTLGIPAPISTDGKGAFDAWRAEYKNRMATPAAPAAVETPEAPAPTPTGPTTSEDHKPPRIPGPQEVRERVKNYTKVGKDDDGNQLYRHYNDAGEKNMVVGKNGELISDTNLQDFDLDGARTVQISYDNMTGKTTATEFDADGKPGKSVAIRNEHYSDKEPEIASAFGATKVERLPFEVARTPARDWAVHPGIRNQPGFDGEQFKSDVTRYDAGIVGVRTDPSRLAAHKALGKKLADPANYLPAKGETATPTGPTTPAAGKEQIDLRDLIAQSKPAGTNAAGEALFENQRGHFRVRYDRNDQPDGYADFGGDLAPAPAAAAPGQGPKTAREHLQQIEAEVSSTGKSHIGDVFAPGHQRVGIDKDDNARAKVFDDAYRAALTAAGWVRDKTPLKPGASKAEDWTKGTLRLMLNHPIVGNPGSIILQDTAAKPGSAAPAPNKFQPPVRVDYPNRKLGFQNAASDEDAKYDDHAWANVAAANMQVGDTFELGGKKQTVESVTDKTLKIKAADGKVRTLNPNGPAWAQFQRDLGGQLTAENLRAHNAMNPKRPLMNPKRPLIDIFKRDPAVHVDENGSVYLKDGGLVQVKDDSAAQPQEGAGAEKVEKQPGGVSEYSAKVLAAALKWGYTEKTVPRDEYDRPKSVFQDHETALDYDNGKGYGSAKRLAFRVVVAQGPNGNWTYSVHKHAGTEGHSASPSVFGKQHPSRAAALAAGVEDLRAELDPAAQAKLDAAVKALPKEAAPAADQDAAIPPRSKIGTVDDPIKFYSGMSRPGDFTKLFAAHRNVGITVSELSKVSTSAIARAMADSNAHLFVDSGAFPIYKRNERAFLKALSKNHIDEIKNEEVLSFDQILARYDAIRDAINGADESGEAVDRAYFVMPDVVGNQAESLRLVGQYASQIKALGVQNAIVPLQVGELSLTKAYESMMLELGYDPDTTPGPIIGIPSNAAAAPNDQLIALLEKHGGNIMGVHILGAVSDARLGPRLDAIRAAGYDGHVSADANRLRALMYGETTRGEAWDELMGESSPTSGRINTETEPAWKLTPFAARIQSMLDQLAAAGDPDYGKAIAGGSEMDAKVGKLDETKTAFREDNVRKRIAALATKGKPPVPVAIEPMTNEQFTELTNVAPALPKPIIDAAVARWNELAPLLAAEGFQFGEVNGSHPKAAQDAQEPLTRIIHALNGLAARRYQQAKGYKKLAPDAVARDEKAATEHLGINTLDHPGIDISRPITLNTGRAEAKAKNDDEDGQSELSPTEKREDDAISAVFSARNMPYDERSGKFALVDRAKLVAAVEQARQAGITVEHKPAVPASPTKPHSSAESWLLTKSNGEAYITFLDENGRSVFKTVGKGAATDEQQDPLVEDAAPPGKEVSRFSGKYGKGMSQANATMAAHNRAKADPANDYTVEERDDGRFDVVGRPKAELAATKPDNIKLQERAAAMPAPPTLDYRLQERGQQTYLVPPVGKAFTLEVRTALRDWLRAAGYFSQIIGDNRVSVSATSDSPELDAIEDGVMAQRIAREAEKERAKADKPGLKKMQDAKAAKDAPAAADRNAIATRYAAILAEGRDGVSADVKAFHLQFADDLLAKDAFALKWITNGLNDKGKKVFAEFTGVKLPRAQGASWEAVKAWAGVTPEQEAAVKAKKDAASAAKQQAKDDDAAENDAYLQRFQVSATDTTKINGKELVDKRIADGFDAIENISLTPIPRYVLVNKERSRFYPLDKIARKYAEVALRRLGKSAVAADTDGESLVSVEQAAAEQAETERELADAKAKGQTMADPDDVAHLFGKKTAAQTQEDADAAMFAELLAQGMAERGMVAPEPAPAPAAPRTAGQAGASALKNLAQGLGDAIDGLGKLFGGNSTLGSGPVFNDETYAKAKPLFDSAVAHLAEAGTDLREMMRTIINMVLDKFGAGTASAMQPYVLRYIADKRNDAEKGDNKPATNDGADHGQNHTGNQGPQALGGVAAGENAGAEGGRGVQPGNPDGGTAGAAGDRGSDGAGVSGTRSGGSGAAAVHPAKTGGTGGRAGAGTGRKGKRVSGNDGRLPGGLTPPASTIPALNFRITSSLRLGRGGETEKFNDNLAAIRALKTIEAENRRATPEEQALLARYVGWGGLAAAFPNPETGKFRDGWAPRGAELEGLLSKKEYVLARRSVLDSHYTSETVVTSMWKAAERLGYKGGLALESSVGAGNFLGLMPAKLGQRTRFIGVEYDSLTARIAGLLYPQETILHSGFQSVPLPDGQFDLAIGNPPFGDQHLRFQFKPELNRFSIHNQFFLASLDAVKPGGLQIQVVSRYLMDAQDPAARIELAKRAKLLGAIRLPDTAFKENARTSVVTDIVFLQRLDAAEEAAMEAAFDARHAGRGKTAEAERQRAELAAQVPEWVNVGRVADPLGGEAMPTSQYFVANPQMVMGTLERSGKMQFKNDITVRPDESRPLEAQLADAIARLPQNVMVQEPSAIDIALERYASLADALQIALAGHEAGAIRLHNDGTLQQIIERETPNGQYELTRRTLTAASPWSEQLQMNSRGQWYKTDVVKGPDGKSLKVMVDGKPTKRNVYEQIVYTDESQVPSGLLLGDAKYARLRQLVALRDALVTQLNLEAEDALEAQIKDNRKALADAYHAFVDAHGLISEQANSALVANMPDGALVQALESGYRKAVTAKKAAATGEQVRAASARPAAILSERVIVKYVPPTSADTLADAIAIQTAESGEVDMDRIASLLGKSEDEVAAEIDESAHPLLFRDPESQSWVTRSDYLTGAVKKKLAAARAAGLSKNASELESVLPEQWGAEHVTALLGSTWVPTQVYQDFLQHITGSAASVSFSRTTNAYTLMAGREVRANEEEWGADGISSAEIIDDILNSRAIKVMMRSVDKMVVDEERTKLALLKARAITNEFGDWVFAESERRNLLVDTFNDRFNTRVRRQHDGTHLVLPGKVPDAVIRMRRHQKNGIWRGITERFMLLDHAVGAGKTYTAIARAMERRRMGLAKKPMIVVPNHMVEQFTADTYRLYPGAKVLAAGKKDFDKARRRKLFAKIATGDYDIIIVPHSSFGFIDIAPETALRYLEEELKAAEAAIIEAQQAAAEAGHSGPRTPFGVKEAQRLRDKITGRMDRIRGNRNADKLLTFEQMGVDDLTVDEAHEFKNLFYSSRLTNIKGMGNKTGSEKAFDLYNKVRVLRDSPKGAVTFMTGTPISNSAVEMYTMMRYLAADELKELGLEHFDAWRAQYVSTDVGWEPNETGRLKEVNRLGRTWSNMRSLMDLYYGFTDAVSNDDIKKAYREDNDGAEFPIPRVQGGDRQSVVIQPTAAQQGMLDHIMASFDSLPNISDPYQRNIERLKLMDRARKVSLDVRAIDPRNPSKEEGGKLEKIADEVTRLYKAWHADLGTQLVFLDRSVPKAKGDDKLVKEYDELMAAQEEALREDDEPAQRRIGERLEKFDANEIAALRDALAGGWNAYQQIKDNLVARGIPANEIRFVQEANNDEQKQALFDAVNDGRVRVLIGSTPRMGAGTNVQERLVALHHADVTWKPSDIEQREGRIIRQGNSLLEKYGMDKFEVEILAYATERTIDAKMWNLNATKLRTINGIRNYDGAFSMEFDDADSVSMAELAALASGDPLLLERVKLMADIDRLELLNRQHARKQWGVVSQIESAEKDIERMPGFIASYQRDAKVLEKAWGELDASVAKRTVQVEGKTYTSYKEAQDAARTAMETQQAGNDDAKFTVKVDARRATSLNGAKDAIYLALGDRFQANIDGETLIQRIALQRVAAERATELANGLPPGGEKNVILGTMLGMPLELTVQRSAYFESYGATLALQRPDGSTMVAGQTSFSQGTEFATSRMAAPLLDMETSAKPEHIARSTADAEQRLETAKRVLPELLPKRDATFPQQGELDEKMARLEDVIRQLSSSPAASRATPDLVLTGESTEPTRMQRRAEDRLRRHADPLFSRGKGGAGMPLIQVRHLVNSIAKGWANAPAITVVQHVKELPFKAPQHARGVYRLGRVWLVADNLHSAAEAKFVLGHETLGHLGLRGIMEPRALANEMNRLRMINPALATAAREQAAKYGYDLTLATEEVLADMAGAGVTIKGWQKFIHTVQQALRAIGLDSLADWMESHSAAETMTLLQRARGAIEGDTGMRPAPTSLAAQYSDGAPNTWYSALSRQIGKTVTKSASPKHWGETIMGTSFAQQGVKQDEIHWSGVLDWLNMQQQAGVAKVSKDALLDYLATDGVRVTERLNGEPESPTEAGIALRKAVFDKYQPQIDDARKRGEDYTLPSREQDEARNELEELFSERDIEADEAYRLPGDMETQVKYANFQLPGGDNYRELVLTLPLKKQAITGWKAKRFSESTGADYDGWNVTGTMENGMTFRSEIGLEDAATEDDAIAAAKNVADGHELTNKDAQYKSSHWDEANVLAHIRFNERTDADGARVLFVEELQSDWAQQGKKQGFATGEKRLGMLSDFVGNDVTVPNGVVPGPFVGKTDAWLSLAIKRVISFAAQNGFDKVAFITGQQSADRYDLSKQIDSITAEKRDPAVFPTRAGMWSLHVDGNDGNPIFTGDVKESELAEHIGEELAAKVIADGSGTYAGLDLKVGGHGMKAFYDKIVPNTVNDVLKKLGADKLGTVEIGNARARSVDDISVSSMGYGAYVHGSIDDEATFWTGSGWADMLDSAKIYPTFDKAEKASEALLAARSLPQPGFTITPALREKALAGLPLFSRSPADLSRQAGAAIKAVTVTSIKNAMVDKRGLGLQMLGRRQLKDLYGYLFPQGIKANLMEWYNKLAMKMDAEKNEAGAAADALTTRWAKLDDHEALAELMHDSTRLQIDPSKPYVYGDIKGQYKDLSDRYAALSEAAKAIFQDAARAYEKHYADVRAAVHDRIVRAMPGHPGQAAMLTRMDADFFHKIKGIYFPLSRFGDYLVQVNWRGIGPNPMTGQAREAVHFAETIAEAQELRKALLEKYPANKGYQVAEITRRAEYNAARDSVGRGFLQQMFNLFKTTGMDPSLQDAINQLYLTSLPDLSWAKHGIHRKGTPGFSQDARRAFAHHMFHGARYLAKLHYADQLTQTLDDMQHYLTAHAQDAGYDPVKAQQVVDEMVKRHEIYMNPKSNSLSTALTSFGFVFFLGLSPASAMVNLSQTALVAYPILGGRYGYGKAGSALLTASKDAMRGHNDMSKVLTGDELLAYEGWVKTGLIDVSMAHDLAGVSQGEDSKMWGKMRPVMKAASFMFHHAEKFNRQATALAAYRLARASGMDHDTAYARAVDDTYAGHFDYAAGNRPRIMQGNVARVVLLFKQYAQNMIYTFSRNAQLAFKGDKQAMKTLSGLLVSHALAAGVLGLPLVGTLLAAASLLGGSDDEPWDAKIALRNLMADAFGNDTAEVLAHGLSRATPFDISSRVGLNQLLLPDVQEGLEGGRLAETYMVGLMGPIAGVAVNWSKGVHSILEGDLQRGLEQIVPAALRGPMKAIRYSQEGVKDRTGIDILPETTVVENAGQFLGLSPSRAREAQEGKSAIYQTDRALQRRRQELMTTYAQHVMQQEDPSEDIAAISAFNQLHPNRMIAPLHLMQSVRVRMQHLAQAKQGIFLPNKRQDAREAGRFAEETP